MEKQDTYRQYAVSFLSCPSIRAENVADQPGHTNYCFHKNVSESTVVCLFETFQPSVWSSKVNLSQHFCRSVCSCFKYHPWNWALPSSCAHGPATLWTPLFPAVRRFRFSKVLSLTHCGGFKRSQGTCYLRHTSPSVCRNVTYRKFVVGF